MKLRIENRHMFIRAMPAGRLIKVRTTRHHPAREDGDLAVLREPAVRQVDLLRRDQHPAPVLQKERPPTPHSSVVGDKRPEQVPKRPVEARPAAEYSQPWPFSSIRNQPASGMIISLGNGMQALSIAIRKTTPGQPMASYRSSEKLTMASSIPSSGPPPQAIPPC